jgi:hypothetical protein
LVGVTTGWDAANAGIAIGGCVLGMVDANEAGPGTWAAAAARAAARASGGGAPSGAVHAEGDCGGADTTGPKPGAAVTTPRDATGIGSVLLVPGTCEPIVAESGCVRPEVGGGMSARVASSRDESRALA